MPFSFVVFRYQPDLMKDEWFPLGVVVECASNSETDIGVMYLASATFSGCSDLASAMLDDVPSIMTKEVEQTRAKLRPGEDFLELLRAQNPWNFHFTVPQTEDVRAENLQEATMKLFYRHVLHRYMPEEAQPKQRPRRTIQPRRMELYELAV